MKEQTEKFLGSIRFRRKDKKRKGQTPVANMNSHSQPAFCKVLS